MKTREEINELFKQAREGTLPPDFTDWDLTDGDRWTIAHEAALFSSLLKDFMNRNLKDKYGITVEDTAPQNSYLPDDFKD